MLSAESCDSPPSPSAGFEHRLSDVARYPDVDQTWDRREDGPDDTVAERGNVGDDDVLEQEQSSDAENVDGGADGVGDNVLGTRDDNVACWKRKISSLYHNNVERLQDIRGLGKSMLRQGCER